MNSVARLRSVVTYPSCHTLASRSARALTGRGSLKKSPGAVIGRASRHQLLAARGSELAARSFVKVRGEPSGEGHDRQRRVYRQGPGVQRAVPYVQALDLVRLAV